MRRRVKGCNSAPSRSFLTVSCASLRKLEIQLILLANKDTKVHKTVVIAELITPLGFKLSFNHDYKKTKRWKQEKKTKEKQKGNRNTDFSVSTVLECSGLI